MEQRKQDRWQIRQRTLPRKYTPRPNTGRASRGGDVAAASPLVVSMLTFEGVELGEEGLVEVVVVPSVIAAAASAARALASPTRRKVGDTPCTNSVSCRGRSCTASDSLMTLWQWMRHTQALMCLRVSVRVRVGV